MALVARRGKRGARPLLALAAAAALGIALLWGLEVAAERGGYSLDPTDPMNYNAYALRNDSSTTLYVHLCSDAACARLDEHFDWITVRAGAAADEQVYWGPGDSAVYAVASDTTPGATRRCLVLDAGTKASATVDAPFSSAGRC